MKEKYQLAERFMPINDTRSFGDGDYIEGWQEVYSKCGNQVDNGYRFIIFKK